MEEVFKSYDVRGLVGSQLTEDLYYKIGFAYAKWLKDQGEIAIGWDMRPSSVGFASALSEGIRAAGRDVVHIGMITTDMIYFAVGHNDFAGGAVITASHNPSEYNGLKLCSRGAVAIGLDSGFDKIRDHALSMDDSRDELIGKIRELDCIDGWINHVLSFAGNQEFKSFKIAVDAGNGMAGKTFPELAKRLPFEITELFFELDGSFPNHEANPLNYDTLKDLQKTILEKSLDFGIAFDGDGDRAALVDDKGQVLSGSEMMAMISEFFLNINPGASITYDVRVSKTVPELINRKGGKAIRTKVGHSIIKHVMRTEDAVFGGEQSGHYYFRDNWYADSGMIAAVVAISILSHSDQKLSELRKDYMYYQAIPETNFKVSNPQASIELIKDKFSKYDQDYLDGVTVDMGENGWFNLRASNTEPVIRLNAEAKTAEDLDQILTEVSKILQT